MSGVCGGAAACAVRLLALAAYAYMSISIAPSLISNAGMCGKKSLPTKKHIKTKSSMTFSRSKPPGIRDQSNPIENSTCRYSLNTQTCRNCIFGGPGRWPIAICSSCFIFALRSSTTSRRMQKCGSWVAKASMMRSASRPWITWRVFGS